MVSVERAPIRFTVKDGKGELEIGTDYYAELEPYRGASRADHAVRHRVLDRARCAGVRRQGADYRSKNAALGIDLDIKNHNALQSTFVFDAA